MKTLWKHQKYALEKYKDRDYFGILFNMGLGKSAAAIAIAEAKERPVLIIAPNAICKQWEEELHNPDTCSKEWEVVLCTSKTKNTKKFKESFAKLCGKRDEDGREDF